MKRQSVDRLAQEGLFAPAQIEVEPDGSATTFYSEQPMFRFRSLDEALRHHRLTVDDLE